MLKMTQDINKEPSIIGGLKYQAVCFYRLIKYRRPGNVSRKGTYREAIRMILAGEARRHWFY